MDEGRPAFVQYVFMDVIKFTQGRTVEAQAYIVRALNEVVTSALDKFDLQPSDRILLPTGDGICIAIHKADPFDIALQVALVLLQTLAERNNAMDDSRRRFQIRIGINQNIDNLVIDVNGHQNVAGRGINMAQRVMRLADGAQILVGEPVHEILCEREVYLNSFRRFSDKDKHGNPFNAYQFLQEHPGLNTEVPSIAQKPTPDAQLSEYAAHFIVNAEVYKQFLLEQRNRSDTTFENNSTVLLHLLTLDSMDQIGKCPFEQSMQRVKRSPEGSIYPTYRRIDESEAWTVAELASSVAFRLAGAVDCFEGAVSKIWAFPSDQGKKRAEVEHPEIWKHVMGGSEAK